MAPADNPELFSRNRERATQLDAGSSVLEGTTHSVPTVAIALVIIAAILITYANSFPGAFYFDDHAAILQNSTIRELSDLGAILSPPVEAGIGGRPFANLTFALNYAVGAHDPLGYRAVNLGIHIAAALLLFGVIRRTFLLPALHLQFGAGAAVLAGFIALLWALHPVQANVVNYVAQRTEGLMGCLYLLTLYAFIRSVETPSWKWNCVAVVACALGMAAKEVMATAPFMVLLFDRVFVSPSLSSLARRHWARHAALWATLALLAALMYSSQLSARGVGVDLGPSVHEYALTQIRAVAHYLQLSYWPNPLLFDYGPAYVRSLGEVWPSAVVLVSALVAAVITLWRKPTLGYAAAWFFVLLAPTSTIIPIVQQPCAENRMYLPSAGALALVVVLAHVILRSRAVPVLAAAVVTLGAITLHRNPVFGSELAIWSETVAKNPGNARAANNLASALLKQNRDDEAMRHIEHAIQLSPDYADAHNNRGVVLLRHGHYEQAVAEFQAAMKNKANYADAQYNLGEAYLRLRRPNEAVIALEGSLANNPRHAKAYNNLSLALLETGRVPESIDAALKALALDSEMPEAHYNLGNSLSRAGRFEEALAAFDAALHHDPSFAKAHNNAGVVLLRLGRHTDAVARFEAALKIRPDYSEAQRNLQRIRR